MADWRSFDPWFVFLSTAHALRRRAERDAPAMGATYGVAAEPLPFQISTVRRILSDVRIRHLIADEVGLGKTIQAIMILNALHSDYPGHQAAIVAPERLLAQWHEELWTRGHILGHIVDDTDRARMSAWRERKAAGEAVPPEDDPAVRHMGASVVLLRPRDVADQPDWLDPVRQHMLVIDEPQSIPREVLDRLQLKADESRNDEAAFRQLLILSATPRLGDPAWRDIIYGLLEPEQMRLAEDAGEDPSAWLDRHEKEAARNLVGLASHELEAQGAVAFRSHARTRRISRQTRAEWGEYFPVRNCTTCLFEPNSTEIERLDLIRTLIASRVESASTSLDAAMWTTVRGLLRSRRSVREAIDRLNIVIPGMAEVRQAAVDDFGDSRLDALTDILAGIFGAEKDRLKAGKPIRQREKVVIVAGDSGTIDMLETVLPRWFPELAEGGIASLRRASTATDSTFEDIRAMQEALEPFLTGNARVLLLGDWIQAGLNLQHSARNMIFYSTPWDPQAIDQLTGRIDRLSKASIKAGVKGNSLPPLIRVWRLIMRHSPEEGLSEAMDALEVFERPVPPVSEDAWAEVNRLILHMVSGSGGATILARLRDIRDTWSARGLASQLDHFAPLTHQRIVNEAQKVGEIAQLLSLAGEEGASAAERTETANADWLKASEKAGGFLFEQGRKDFSLPPRRYAGFWYASRQTEPPFLLQAMDKDREADDKVALLIHRRHLSVPPIRTVQASSGGGTPHDLRFFEHGDAIHDGLCQGWLDFGLPVFGDGMQGEIVVKVGDGHPALALGGRPVAMTIAVTRLRAPPPPINNSDFGAALDWFPQTARDSYLAQLGEGVAADHRWLQTQLPSRLRVRASVLKGQDWEDLDTSQIPALLRARPNPEDRTRISGTLQKLRLNVDPVFKRHLDEIDNEFNALRSGDLKSAVEEWKRRLKVIYHDARIFAQVFRNRAENRARGAATSMAALRRGQVEANERREALVGLLAQARTRIAKDLIAAAIRDRTRVTLHACVRFVAPENL